MKKIFIWLVPALMIMLTIGCSRKPSGSDAQANSSAETVGSVNSSIESAGQVDLMMSGGTNPGFGDIGGVSPTAKKGSVSKFYGFLSLLQTPANSSKGVKLDSTITDSVVVINDSIFELHRTIIWVVGDTMKALVVINSRADTDSTNDILVEFSVEKRYHTGLKESASAVDADGDGYIHDPLITSNIIWVRVAKEGIPEPDEKQDVIDSLKLDMGQQREGPTSEDDDYFYYFREDVLFRDGHTTLAKFEPDAPVPAGQEPPSGKVSCVTTYPNATGDEIKTLNEEFRFSQTDSTCWQQDIEYANNTSSLKKVIFYNVPVDTIDGRVYEKYADGTIVNGEFNDAKDDNAGWFHILTDYPDASDRDTRDVSGTYSKDASGEHGSFSEIIVYSDGKADTSQVTADKNISTGIITLTVSNPQGNGEFTIQETLLEKTITGWWQDNDNKRTTFEIHEYPDRHRNVKFEVYEGETMVAYGTIYYNPDNSGHGTIYVLDENGNWIEYTITFGSDGSHSSSSVG